MLFLCNDRRVVLRVIFITQSHQFDMLSDLIKRVDFDAESIGHRVQNYL